MKLSVLLELLFILIIIAFAASKPLNSGKEYSAIALNSNVPNTKQAVGPSEPEGTDDEDDDDEEDEDFSLGVEDDEDDDADYDSSPIKPSEIASQKDPQKDKDKDVDVTDVISELFGFDDDDDEEDANKKGNPQAQGASEDDLDGSEFLILGDDLFGLIDDEEVKKKNATTKPTHEIIQENLPTIEVESNAEAQPVIQAHDVEKPAPESAGEEVIENLAENEEATNSAPELVEGQTDATATAADTATASNADDDNKEDIKEESEGTTIIATSAVEFQEPIKVSPETNKDGEILDESGEDDGMIVVSDETLTENIKASDNFEQVNPEENEIASALADDKDMNNFNKLPPPVSFKTTTVQAPVVRKPTKKKDDDDILDIVGSFIAGDDDDDDEASKPEDDEEKDENPSDETSEEDDEDEEEEITDTQQTNDIKDGVKPVTKDEKKKKKKTSGIISSIGQTLGLSRLFRSTGNN